MLIEDTGICKMLRRIVTRLTSDPTLQDDLMQECLIRLWKLEIQEPGRTRSWYLQNCRFHLQHFLAAGRSLDSLKRAHSDKRVSLDGVDDPLPANGCAAEGELLGVVSANDIVSTLAGHLKPCESALLGGLADGLVLQDIALKLKMSYPTALKYRRKIAALTIKLGIAPPPSYKRQQIRQLRRANRIGHRQPRLQINGVKHAAPTPDFFRASRASNANVTGRVYPNGFKQIMGLTRAEPDQQRSRAHAREAGHL